MRASPGYLAQAEGRKAKSLDSRFRGNDGSKQTARETEPTRLQNGLGRSKYGATTQ